MTLRLLGDSPRSGGAVVGLRTTIVDSFLADDARFFGELGLPDGQAGFVDSVTGAATITLVQENVFGVTKQVVRHVDNTDGGFTNSKRALSVQDWLNIQEFGAVYGGRTRLDSVNGERGFFTGLVADAAENPTGAVNRRFGLLFEESISGGFLKVTQADFTSTNIDFDGTLGNPIVMFDEWFDWQIVVPAGLGAGGSGKLFIGTGGPLVEVSFIPIFLINGGGLGSEALISSGSTTGFDRVVLHDNFGVTIYKESATKTLSVAAMQADTAQVIFPEGNRDYTIILPDGNPRKIGSRILLTKRNIGGTITLKAFDTANPEAVFGPDKLAQITKETFNAQDVTLVNSVDNANVYDFGIAPSGEEINAPIFVGLVDKTLANSAGQFTILGAGIGNRVLRANSLKVGDCIQFRIGGILSAAANPTLMMKLMMNTVFIGNTTPVIIANITDGHWDLIGTATVRKVGVTGEISVEGGFQTSANDHFRFTFLAATMIDTTVNQVLDILAQWGTMAVGNSVTTQNASFIKLLAPR